MADVIASRERGTSGDEADQPAPPGRPVRRRWPVWLALGLVVAAAAALLTVWRAAPEATVLVLVREVPPGHELLAEDVRQVAVTGLEGVEAPSAPAEIVGRTMGIPAAEGSVLTAQMFNDVVFPEYGTALVGVSVRQGAYPPGLAAGARVGVVATDGAALGGDPVSARVLSVRPSPAGAVLMMLQLAQWDAPAVAAGGAQRRVALFGLARV